VSDGYIRARSQYLGILQIIGAIAVIGFHVGIPFSSAAWILVELFFVIAGINMVNSVQRSSSLAQYFSRRILRVLPEFMLVFVAAGIFAWQDTSTEGILWFVATAPLFLHNLTLPFFRYSFPADWIFGPLWFVGALFQLQLTLYLLRRFWIHQRPAIVVGSAVICGIAFRYVASRLLAPGAETMDEHSADALYCLPFTHIEAITIGLMIGRGSLGHLARWLPVFLILLLAMGAMNLWYSGGPAFVHSLGLQFPLRLNYTHIFGYTILAFAVGSLCAVPALFPVPAFSLPETIKHWCDYLARLTYGAYAMHGVVLALGLNGAAFRRTSTAFSSLVLFSVTVVESFFFAWLLKAAERWMRQRSAGAVAMVPMP
jgi:hypothetical protein